MTFFELMLFLHRINKIHYIMKKNPIEEARRYVDNAKQTLIENGKLNMETHRYEDPKYVRAAGNYLWLGVLMALDAVFEVRKDRRTRVNKAKTPAMMVSASPTTLLIAARGCWLPNPLLQNPQSREAMPIPPLPSLPPPLH